MSRLAPFFCASRAVTRSCPSEPGSGAGKTSPTRLDQGLSINFRKAAEEAIAKLPRKTINNQVEDRIARVDE
ncbi:MAG: hypothetical protein ACRESZ_11755 [Methylococcales bacterium]